VTEESTDVSLSLPPRIQIDSAASVVSQRRRQNLAKLVDAFQSTSDDVVLRKNLSMTTMPLRVMHTRRRRDAFAPLLL